MSEGARVDTTQLTIIESKRLIETEAVQCKRRCRAERARGYPTVVVADAAAVVTVVGLDSAKVFRYTVDMAEGSRKEQRKPEQYAPHHIPVSASDARCLCVLVFCLEDKRVTSRFTLVATT